MKVLVTGGMGFIGQYVVEELMRLGHTALIIDPHPKGEYKGELFLGDIRDAVAVTEAMAHSEAWIHLAGVLGTQETIANPKPAVETNILGGLNVFEAATQYKLPGVNIAVGNYWETNTYSITKNTAERFAAMFRKYRDLQVTNVRAFNAYGPRQSVAFPFGESKVRKIMPSFICRALVGLPIEIYGTGEQIMDMIYVENVAQILVRTLIYTMDRGALDLTIEAGSGNKTSVNSIADLVASRVKEKYAISVKINHISLRKGETPRAIVVADSEKIRFLDKKDSITLSDGIDLTLDYYNQNLPEILVCKR
jgi:UDP-glucose 4-epimerase